VLKAGLCNLEGLGESLALHEKSKVITAVVRMVNLSNFNSIISKEVMDNEGKVVEAGEEPKDSAVVIEELLLALNTATTEGLLHVLLE